MKRGAYKLLACMALAVPGLLMLRDFASGHALAMDLLEPSGETALRLMVLAMLPGPLIEAFGANRFLRAWLLLRRNFGVAAFAYGLLHLGFYAADMTLAAMIDEIGLPGIWTGWLALFLLLPPAMISTDRAVRRLGRNWKTVQRLVYAALALVVAHWLLLAWEWLPVLLHLAPLALAWALRLRQRRSITRLRSPA